MKAIVVRQPWATLIALGIKTIETRPSPPNGEMRPDGVRGLPGCSLARRERIAIVAGATQPRVGLVGEGPLFVKHLNGNPNAPLMAGGYAEGPWLCQVGPPWLGAVVCTVTVDEALPIVDDDSPRQRTDSHFLYRCDDDTLGVWVAEFGGDELLDEITDQLPLGDFTPGRWGWMLSNPQPCDPIPCKGKQGVFELPADVAASVGGEA